MLGGAAAGDNLVLEAARTVAQVGSERRAGKSGWGWPLFVVGLLALPVVFGGWLAWAATHGADLWVEKDYYKKAIDWDRHMAQQRTNAQLGWTVAVQPLHVGQGPALVTLRDSQGAPVTGAMLQLQALHLAHAGTVARAQAVEGAPGQYAVAWTASHAGVHEWNLTATRGAETFTWTHHVEAAP